jgi:hypothetical protein
MPEVKYADGRGPAQRIHDKLKPSCPDYAQRPIDRLAANAEAETVPTRTVTTIYYGGSVRAHGGGR